MKKQGSFFDEKVEARIREPSPLWHYLPVAAGLCFAAFGLISGQPDRIIDLTALSMRPSIVAASAIIAVLALGTLSARPRRARLAVASSLLMIAAAFMAFLPYQPVLSTHYLNMSVHDPATAVVLAKRIVSLGKPATQDGTRLDAVLEDYMPLSQDDRVPVHAFGISYWPPEEIGYEFTPHAGEAAEGTRVTRGRAFMLARNLMWYAPGDSIPLFVVCEYTPAPIPLEAWVEVQGELGPGTIEVTTGFLPTIWAEKAGPGKQPRDFYLRRRY